MGRTTVSFHNKDVCRQLGVGTNQSPVHVHKYENASIVQIDESVDDYDNLS